MASVDWFRGRGLSLEMARARIACGHEIGAGVIEVIACARSLLVPERDHGLDANGTTCRYPAGQGGHGNDCGYGGAERERIVR